jgi:hypothetical protein
MASGQPLLLGEKGMIAEVRGIELPHGHSQTAFLAIRPPANAKIGDSFDFDLIQHYHGRAVSGGCTTASASWLRSRMPQRRAGGHLAGHEVGVADDPTQDQSSSGVDAERSVVKDAAASVTARAGTRRSSGKGQSGNSGACWHPASEWAKAPVRRSPRPLPPWTMSEPDPTSPRHRRRHTRKSSYRRMGRLSPGRRPDLLPAHERWWQQLARERLG